METFLLEHQSSLYTGLFVVTFIVVALWEELAPRRELAAPMATRWGGNFGIMAVDFVVLFLVFPGFAYSLSLTVAQWHWGLLHLVALPGWFEGVVAFVLLDLGRYCSHWLLHHVGPFWRCHRVHHNDQDIDVTTGLRFHPGEGVIDKLMGLVPIILIGPSAIALLLFLLITQLTMFWAHGNVRMPIGLDRRLRWLLVTPEMHRIHHSAREAETNSNYGGFLSVWDRLFGSYVAAPAGGHRGMAVGLAEFSTPEDLRLTQMLLNPLRNPPRPPKLRTPDDVRSTA